MASYLTTFAIGDFKLHSYRAGGHNYVDAIDETLLETVAPRTGAQYAYSQAANQSYKRLSRVISVDATGAMLDFWVNRDTESEWDYFLVEAHPVGSDDWTTLPDANGHTTQDTGQVCPVSIELHPFLEHYQTATDGGCDATGTTGDWWAASGSSNGWEQWSVDLSGYAGSDVEVAISYVSDDTVQMAGVFVDDIEVSAGVGSTSFEADADPLDGWSVSGPPAGSIANANDWTIGDADLAPTTIGEFAANSFDRQPEFIAFMSSKFGRYPFADVGGILDDDDALNYALETQTRPVYRVAWLLHRPGCPLMASSSTSSRTSGSATVLP